MPASPTPTIRPMTPGDAARAAAAVLAGGWGDRGPFFEFATRAAGCRPFVAEVDGEIVGTGVATINGPVGWVGTIFVSPEQRGRGLGLALTMTVVDVLEGAGCRTLVLVATQLGRPLYERIGFTVQTTYRTLEAPGLPAGDPIAKRHADDGAAESRVRPYQPGDLEAICALDRRATGEDRRHLLAAFATPESGHCLVRADGILAGFIVRAPWGGGATVAPDVADALVLLDARRRAAGPERRVRAGVLADNDAGLRRLLADGWTEAWSAPRLLRGAPLDWEPRAMWGQFNHAIG